MRKSLFLFLASALLASCEKETNEPNDSNQTKEEVIIGKWHKWKFDSEVYDSLNNNLGQGVTITNDNNLVEFIKPSTMNYFVSNNLISTGTYSIVNNKINLSIPNTSSPFFPNPYSGYLDSLNTKRIVFRDTTYLSDGEYKVSIYSATRN